MNQEYYEPKEKKSLKWIIIAGFSVLIIVIVAATIGFFATKTAVHAANDQAVKDEIITQNTRLRQSAVDGVLTGDSIERTKSTETVDVALKVAGDGKQYCIEAAFHNDPKAIRYHMDAKTPELEPVKGLCGDNATEKPATPGAFTLGSIGGGALSFSWEIIPSARSYTLTCKTDGASAVSVKTTKSAATIENLKSAAAYTCQVLAENSAGESGASADLVATTKAPLAVPQGLKMTGRTATTLSYSWTALKDIKYYVVEYASDPSFMKDVKTFTTTTPQTTLTGLKSETAYFVHVKAVTQTVTEQQAPYSGIVQGRTEK